MILEAFSISHITICAYICVNGQILHWVCNQVIALEGATSKKDAKERQWERRKERRDYPRERCGASDPDVIPSKESMTKQKNSKKMIYSLIASNSLQGCSLKYGQ